jgi:D-apiose dehydrogenase
MVGGTVVAPGFPARGQDHLQLIGRHAAAVFAGGRLQRLGPQPESIPYDIDAGYQASFDAVIEHFVACLQSGARFETDAADNLETLRLVEHAYLAAGLHHQPES